MSLPRYESYRDSGVEWLGEVPAGWEVKRIGSLFREVSEQGEDDLPVLSVSIHHGVSDRELSDDDLDRKIVRSDDRSKYRKVEPGDLTYNMMRAWQGGFGTVSVKGMVSPAYVVARPTTKASTQLIEHQLRTPQAIVEMKRRSKGVTDFRLRLYWDDFKPIEVAVPPEQTQSAIIAYLDRETARIDGLVAEQRRLVGLLAEKRRAAISHAVTRGLDPAAPRKPTGVPWLGDVPEHWNWVPLKHLTQEGRAGIQMGPFGESIKNLLGEDTGFKVVGQENTIANDWSRGTRWVEPERFEELAAYHVEKGDILLTRKGSIGHAWLVTDDLPPTLMDSDTIRVRIEGVEPHYLLRLLREALYVEHQVTLTKRGAILSGLNTETVSSLKLLVPPPNEQRELIKHLDSLTTHLESLTADAESAIALLLERRSALISAAVTGRIDVRGLADAPA